MSTRTLFYLKRMEQGQLIHHKPTFAALSEEREDGHLVLTFIPTEAYGLFDNGDSE